MFQNVGERMSTYFQVLFSVTFSGKNSLDPAVRNDFLLVVRAKDMAGQSINLFATEADVKITVLENLWKSPPEVLLLENSTKPHPMTITRVSS